MPQYRIYILSPNARRANCSLLFSAEHDEAAKRYARERQREDWIELWSEGRKIARMEPLAR
jgi:hypothetical protein